VTRRGLPLAALALLSALLIHRSASAETVEHCAFGDIALGQMLNTEVSQRFAVRQGGSVTPGSAQRITVRVWGCDAAAAYRLSIPSGYSVINQKTGKTVTLWPTVVAVNGVSRTPQLIAGSGNSIDLTGNPALELVIAADQADLSLLEAQGLWSGRVTAIFEDR